MDSAVRTGSTIAARDVSLVSLQLESLQGEKVCLLMEIGAREKGAQSIERECEAVIKHALLDAEGDAATRLDSTLKELNGLLKGMLVGDVIHEVHMILGILDGEDTLHVSHAGRAEAYLIRRGSASQVTEYAGKPTPAFVHIASGQLEDGDLVIFSTQRLLRTFTPAQLARLTSDKDGVMEGIIRALEAEGEHAALATCAISGSSAGATPRTRSTQSERRAPLVDRRRRMQSSSLAARLPRLNMSALPSFDSVKTFFNSFSLPSSSEKTRSPSRASASDRGAAFMESVGGWWESTQDFIKGFIADLNHPQRKKRAHLLLIAAALAAVVIVWAMVHLFTSSQRSKTRAELEQLVEQISTEIQTAENRSLIGDNDAANAILQRAEERAKQVMDNEAGLFRVEANELLGCIRSKREEINNIVRLTPRVVANLSANNPDVSARGLIGLGDGEFMAYDKQDAYRVLLNSVESPAPVSSENELILDGSNFPRFQSQVFLMKENSIVELQNGQAITMKTDDPMGWMSGIAMDAYLRFIYVLSPESKQIYKYERLNNRYGPPVGYNVNGELTGALDMAIDGNVYVLRDTAEGRQILKLFRGETQSFVIRQAPDDILEGVTKIFKIADRNFYALDPEGNRVIVFSDGGATGESTYLKQYVLEGDQLSTLQDVYVNEDESQLYVLDDKRIYVVDLTTR